MAEHAEGSTEVFATAAEVMAVVAGFEAYPEWVAGLEAGHHRHHLGGGGEDLGGALGVLDHPA